MDKTRAGLLLIVGIALIAAVAACGANDDEAASIGSGTTGSTVAELAAAFDWTSEIDTSGGTVCTTESVQFTDTSTGQPTSWRWSIQFRDETITFDEPDPHWAVNSSGDEAMVTLEVGDAEGRMSSVTETLGFPLC